MKKRFYFVSNSSSSSFIVGLKEKPKSVSELQDIMFKNQQTISFYDDHMTCSDVAKRVFDDLKDQSSLSLEKMIEACSEGYIDELISEECPDYHDYCDGKLIDGDWDRYEEDLVAYHKKSVDFFKNKYPDVDCYFFEYSDNEGEALLEHGDIFRNLPHFRISKH